MTAPDLVKRIVVDQDLDTLAAFSADGTRKLDYVQGTPDKLSDAIDLMEVSIPGPYRLQGSRSQQAGKIGRRADGDKPFEWTMRGALNAAPVLAAPAQRAELIRVPSEEAIKQAAEARADARIAEYKQQAIAEELEKLRTEISNGDEILDLEDDDDDAEDGEPMGEAPWYHDAEKTVTVAKEITGLLRDLLAKPAAPLASQPGLTEEERTLLQAARKYKANDPEGAAAVFGQLIANFPEP